MRKISNLILLVCLLVAASAAHAQAAQHGINLTWVQSDTPSIVSDSVYSAPTAAGPFTKIYTSPAAITNYLVPVTNLNAGTPACFEVSATAQGSDESALTAPVCLTFPLLKTDPNTGLQGHSI